jgi:hypothetical protein
MRFRRIRPEQFPVRKGGGIFHMERSRAYRPMETVPDHGRNPQPASTPLYCDRIRRPASWFPGEYPCDSWCKSYQGRERFHVLSENDCVGHRQR